MIKKLQLRGISRTPSDRASADGGCAESLNVHLDQGETAPTMPPEDISETIYGENTRYQIMFIHKMPSIKNYIGIKYDSTNRNYKFAAYNENGTMDNMGNAVTYQDDTPVRFASIGNTLIAYSANRPYYFLYKDGAYIYLGTSIPKPSVEIASLKADNRYATAEIEDEVLKVEDDEDVWNSAAISGNEHNAGLLSTMRNLWDSVKLGIGNARNDGVFVAPFFIRYALKLYDGSYIHTSTPIICGGAQSQNWLRVFLSGTESYTLSANFTNAFRVYLHGTYIAANWGDLVKSIDFFASTPIYAPAMESAYYKMTASNEIIFEKMGDAERAKTIHDEVFSKGQFYKIKSIEINDSIGMGELYAGTLHIDNADGISGDLLLEQETMVDPYRDGSQYIPGADAQNFNSRLLLVGGKEMLSRGDDFLNGQATDTTTWDGTLSGRSQYTLRFKIVDSATGNAHYVVSHYRHANPTFYPSYFYKNSTAVNLMFGSDSASSGQYLINKPYAWIAYPDTRCKQVEIYYSPNTNAKVIPMEPHPYLECAVAFLGFGVPVTYLSNYDSVTPTTEENPVIDSENKLFLSEFQNPFLFKAGGIITFPDKLVGAAGITVPLSEGQVGDYSVYVFTEGGIRVLVPTAEGTFAANLAHPGLSRHIALPNTIRAMEQAIVFTTKKGVMILSGGTVTDISLAMNGKPYTLEAEVRQMLLRSPWMSILSPTNDTETFMAFMRTAMPAYDFNGGRFIFFNPQKEYQYVYMLETQTWHKTYTGVDNPTILNSYPDCLVSRRRHNMPDNTHEVLDFSTILDDADYVSDEADSVLGIIATRPFDLGEPDIRKAIRSIRIRGNYNRNNVKYIILGSFDGINWKRLTSLRGGSYKQFRLILLTDLTATERITWVDVDYESRFTNRLR
jgi:hypothetical protein